MLDFWISRVDLMILDFETSIFEFLDQFYLLVPVFRLILLFFHFSGVGRGRGRSFVFQDSGLRFLNSPYRI